jgi:hypothetical protein
VVNYIDWVLNVNSIFCSLLTLSIHGFQDSRGYKNQQMLMYLIQKKIKSGLRIAINKLMIFLGIMMSFWFCKVF